MEAKANEAGQPAAFRFGFFGESDSDADEPQSPKGEVATARLPPTTPVRTDVDAGRVRAPSDLQILRKSLCQSVQSLVIPLASGPRLGLDNLGNTCFAAAALQALWAVPAFMHALIDASKSKNLPHLLSTLELILANSEETRHWEVFEFCKQFCGGEEGVGEMHDASEFLLWLLHALHDEQQLSDKTGSSSDDEWEDVTRNRSKVTKSGLVGEKTFVSTLFVGTLLSTVETVAGRPSTTQESFFSLALHIDNPAVKSVNDLLVSYCAPEFVQHKQSQGRKTIEFDELPRVLLLVMNRFKFDQRRNKAMKLGKAISVPLNLVLPPSLICEKRRKIFDLGSRNAQAEASLPSSYELVAMIRHVGETANSGHYTTQAKTADGRWFLYDDSRVSLINVDSSVISSSDAYVLMYVRKWNLKFPDSI